MGVLPPVAAVALVTPPHDPNYIVESHITITWHKNFAKSETISCFAVP